jgi:hypothetical protein
MPKHLGVIHSSWGTWGEVAQAMYTYMSKCKNDKIKNTKNKQRII